MARPMPRISPSAPRRLVAFLGVAGLSEDANSMHPAVLRADDHALTQPSAQINRCWSKTNKGDRRGDKCKYGNIETVYADAMHPFFL
jgi:hypothetical protein